MILRKPYGFLIKHFKLIHLILTAIYIYLAIKVNSLLKYYNDFINGTERKINAMTHVNNYYLIAIIAAAIICLIIYALMRYKKKPKLLYVILIILYIAVTIVIITTYRGLYYIYIDTLSMKELRLYRDILRIIIIFQYISIFFTLIRGLGFDIKKFNFKEDINELNLEVTDEEEVELTVGNTEGLKRKIRRQLREYKYYYKENKLLINVFLIIIIAIGSISIIINKKVINKEFQEGEFVNGDKFNILVKNTYITSKNYKGINVSKSNYTFVIAKIILASNVGKTTFNNGTLILKANNNTYISNTKLRSNFKDIGISYTNKQISSQETYLFIFDIPKEDTKSNMQLIYGDDKKININPINLDETGEESNYNIGDKLDLSQTILDNGSIIINKYEVKNKLTYTYNYALNGQNHIGKINIISPMKTILYLETVYEPAKDLLLYEFITNYGKIKYKIGDTEYSSQIPINKTPTSYKNGLYLEIDKNVENANNIWLELTIRNKKYKYTLK